MNTELRRKSPSVFSEKTYTDEPIIRTAAQLKTYEPPEYREMRRIGYNAYEKGWSAEHIFYEQAKFMNSFEDNCPFDGAFSSYFPTYTAMTPAQQRGYFSWRAAVRRGEIKSAPTAFAFVYMYELINLTGADTPDEAFFKLYSFSRAFSVYAPEVCSYAQAWLRDFIAFYDLDASLYSTYCDFDFEHKLEKILNSAQTDDITLFEALCDLSVYDIKRSELYADCPGEVAFAVCAAFRSMTEKYNKTHKTCFAEKLFGSITALPYTVFGSAVFYDRTNVKDHSTVLSGLYEYTFFGGQCICRRCRGKRGKSGVLGDYIRYTDSVLRRVFGCERQFDAVCPAKPFEKIALAAAQRAFDMLTARKRAEELSYIDASRLDSIIFSSDKTREMLLTDEERDEAVPAAEPEPAAAEAADGTEGAEPEDGLPVSGAERGFLCCLLNGGDIRAFAAENGLKISLACDSINEKLFEVFSDNVIDFDGDIPVLIGDYADDLAGMISGR